MKIINSILLGATLLFSGSVIVAAGNDMVSIQGGNYRPLYLKKNMPQTFVKPFKIDKFPVTNAQFAQFVHQNPQWQRGKVANRHADGNYLRHWQAQNGVFNPKKIELNYPVTHVSWFAANAYCRAQNKRLPTIDEWEFAGLASEKAKNGSSDPNFSKVILDWYAEGGRRGLRNVGAAKPNYYGVYDMHGLIWEWTEDFNSSLLNAGSADSSLFCGGGSANSTDPSDYAAFMRYGMRTSVQANFTVKNMGFRCVAN